MTTAVPIPAVATTIRARAWPASGLLEIALLVPAVAVADDTVSRRPDQLGNHLGVIHFPSVPAGR